MSLSIPVRRDAVRKTLLSITIISLVSAAIFFVDPIAAFAKGHFIKAMGMIKFKENVPAPDFALVNLEGQIVSLSDYRGKLVFVNFWATWCPPCRAEMPSMEKLYQEFKDKDFVILAVNMQERRERVKAFMDELGLSFPVLLDTAGSVARKYGVRGLPATLLVGRDGNTISGAIGARDWYSGDARALVEYLLSPD
jgi:peroxiredoxin